MEVLPSDSAYLSFESSMTKEVHVAFLDTILNPEFSLNQPGMPEESFWVAEEARFASMRAAQFPASEFAKRLPKEYWSQLVTFQRLQTSSKNEASNVRGDLAILERKLNLMEMEAGLSVPHGKENGAPAVGDWKRNLPAGEAVFSYYLSEPSSLAWVASMDGIAVRRIAGKKKIAIFYGAGHMTDIEKHLEADFHLERSADQWLTAWKLEKPAAPKPAARKPNAGGATRRPGHTILGMLSPR